jgi:hypothetical protein
MNQSKVGLQSAAQRSPPRSGSVDNYLNSGLNFSLPTQ